MALPPAVALEPRKAPLQARSRATVQAIHEAGFQVLVRVGPRRLTTTQVAERAGVSIGTLYQYYPNRSALLAALLASHLDDVVGAVETACAAQRHAPLSASVTAIVDALIAAKFARPEISRALYAVLAETQGALLARRAGHRAARAIAATLACCSDIAVAAPERSAAIVCETASALIQAALAAPAGEMPAAAQLRGEIVDVALGYLLRAAPRPRKRSADR